jgi:REP element-mobilizing transposase RayT
MLYKNKYRIESARLKEFDYSSNYWYYVTINTKNHLEFFGKVKEGKVLLNQLGNIVDEEWRNISVIRSGVDLDSYKIMPNHFHGILIVNQSSELKTVKTHRDASLQNPVCVNSLSNIIRGFKGAVTKRIHHMGMIKFEWQSRFYDHIIRTEKDLARIREYIDMNPLKWEIEKNNPENIFSD